MTFQKYAAIIAIVFLVLMLGLIAFMLYKSKTELAYPPNIAECPDYWEVSGNGVCNNVKKLGSCAGSADFSSPDWLGQTGLKKKYCWAKGCGVTWDGVTNNNAFANGVAC